jgi:PAS domain S-box-containing protein
MVQKKVLIAEDEGVVALSLQLQLQKLGYTVAGPAMTGAEVVQMAIKEKPDVILMDIHLKGDMDGIQATAEINKLSDIPVIFLTAYADDETVKRALVTESCSYLVKPFNPRELYSNIELALYRHRMKERVGSVREKLEMQMTNEPISGIIIDMNGKVVYANPETEALTGWKSEDLIGRNFFEALTVRSTRKNKEIDDLLARILALDDVTPIPYQATIMTRSGKVRSVQIEICLVKEDDTANRNFLLFMKDNTYLEI